MSNLPVRESTHLVPESSRQDYVGALDPDLNPYNADFYWPVFADLTIQTIYVLTRSFYEVNKDLTL
jgi:hypothetical protein